jgi:hypothetical protein
MKAGWKNRIEERRYFEEKQKAHMERCVQMQTFRMRMKSESMYREMMDEFKLAEKQRSHEPDHR